MNTTTQNPNETTSGGNFWERNAPLINKAKSVARAIGSGTRQEMMQYIDSRGKVTVTEIYEYLQMDQPIASRHLGILRESNLVNTERDGKFIYYSVNKDNIEKMLNCVKHL